jgi:hypothetical protein
MATYDDAPDTVCHWLEAGADAIDLVLPFGAPEAQLGEMLEAAAPAISQPTKNHRDVHELGDVTAGRRALSRG